MLFNIHDNCWDQELLELLRVPASMLPEVKDCAADFGMHRPSLFGAAIPSAASPATSRRPWSARPVFSRE
jgi:glycerol kinase